MNSKETAETPSVVAADAVDKAPACEGRQTETSTAVVGAEAKVPEARAANEGGDSAVGNGDGAAPNEDAAVSTISTDEASGQEGRITEAMKTNPDSLWLSDAPLWCPITGYSHAVLSKFLIERCKACGHDVRSPPMISRSKIKTAEVGGDGEPAVDVVETPGVKNVAYSIEYRDQEDYYISAEPWPEPFDLATARKGVDMEKAAVFEVVTVLKTTIEGSERRYAHETAKLVDDGILSNNKIGVEVTFSKITVTSPAILAAINAVVSYYPDTDIEGKTITLTEPYPLIAHHMTDLEKIRDKALLSKKSTEDGQPTEEESATGYHKDTAEHLDLLLEHIQQPAYKDSVKDEKARYARNMCTFRMLWLLFKPGETVYHESDGHLGAYVVSQVDLDSSVMAGLKKKPAPYTVSLWNLDFDGKYVCRSRKNVTIPHFEGERAITSLKVFPCEYVDKSDGGKTREQLEQNGKRWYELLSGKQVYYNGPVLNTSHVQKPPVRGRVYIDTASFLQQFPKIALDNGKVWEINDMGEGLSKCPCEECKGRRTHPPSGFRWAKYDMLDPLITKDLELEGTHESPRHRYLLCPRRLMGMVLRSREWEAVDVRYCKEPKINTRAIQDLVMQEERKTMIEALVQKFSHNKDVRAATKHWRADHIEHKGEGQIILLHGGPGVGKTFTAECIAEYTGRALLSLTSGDIGINHLNVEMNLSRWFRLAETWGAVMLIDEADIYLERREVSDLPRNSLVSVFLRCIEYYRGILFLTTNRVGIFDDAFMSRIHVVIAYDKLGATERAKIWKQFFVKLSEDREDITITSRAKKYVLEDPEMLQVEWNGREIRNAFQTAVALAEYRFSQKADKTDDDCAVLDQRDFEQVREMTFQFKTYLTTVHGADEEDRAFYFKTRAGRQYSER